MKTIVQRLAAIFPSDRINDSNSVFAALPSTHKPIAIVIPHSNDEAIECVQFCHDHGVPFEAHCRAANSTRHFTLAADGIVISLDRLNQILSIDPLNRIATVQPGVHPSAVSKAAATYGLETATRGSVLGMKVVTGGGQVIELGARTVQSIGPDLCGLFCSSHGLFGIPLEITLRLWPLSQTAETDSDERRSESPPSQRVFEIEKQGPPQASPHEPTMRLMRRLQSVFDPKKISNSSNIFPTGQTSLSKSTPAIEVDLAQDPAPVSLKKSGSACDD